MNKKIGFIGAGNMATAIINGIIKNKASDPGNIFVFDVDKEKIDALSEQMHIIPTERSTELLLASDIVVLAVKPQNYAEVLSELKQTVSEEKVFVSIAAGISIEYIRNLLCCNCPCVRVMPNTPLLLGEGATAICPSENIDEESFDTVRNMFALSGVCEVLPESQMNTVIAVNGSSPAYIYLFAKAMADYAKEQGIDENAAMRLICATLKGSAAMLERSGDTPDELIRKVSSKGGTTIEALNTLAEKDFCGAVKQAMASCTKRAFELGK